MNDVAILHLSDLHIDNTGHNYSRLLKGLLADIKKEIKKVPDGKLVVAVTGDIIHQGKQGALDAAKHFFQDLKQTLGEKSAGIYIVPGNHDKARTEENKFLVSAYRKMLTQENCSFDDTFQKSFWPIHLNTYSTEHGSGYIELTKYIYKLFGVDTSKEFVENTFGVDMLEIGGKRYCFVLLNTSWSSMDDNDTRNLIFGDFQMQRIKASFHDITDGDMPCLTFVLGHHPIGCFNGVEEDKVFSEMISFEELDANVYLCGHTHDRTAINWYNNRHSINTLMTGVGWPESGKAHVGDHYYSLYVFNTDINSIDVYVRNTNDGGTFFPDFKIYTNDADTSAQKLVLPIKAQAAHAYISLGSGVADSSKAVYVSNSLLKYAQQFGIRIGKFCKESGCWQESDKSGFFDGFCTDGLDMSPEEADEVVYNHLFAQMPQIHQETEQMLDQIFRIQANKNLSFRLFLGFLQRICQRLQTILLYGQDMDSTAVRFHFRYLEDKNSYLYGNLCSSFSAGIEEDQYRLSDMKYSDLIEAAYREGCSLIYLANEELCQKKLNAKWWNFITVIPKFQKNEFRRKVSEDNVKVVPLLTFGVTIESQKFDDLLYCLDFYRIDQILGDLIDSYTDVYRINMEEFCSWLKNEKRKEELSCEHETASCGCAAD